MKNRDYYFEIALTAALLIVSFYLFKLPVKHIPILFYDDAELSYHSFSIASGKIPYLDDQSHHFLGYTLPLIIWGKLFGFSSYLVRSYAMFNQVLVGLGILILVRPPTSFFWSLIAALLYISAREPWVPGFPIQNEINLLIVAILFTLHSSNKSCTKERLTMASFLAGIAFIFDQRALLLVIIPVFEIFSSESNEINKARMIVLSKALLAWAIAPASVLFWLWKNSALTSFIEQTFIFPSRYRVGSFSLLDSLRQGLSLHSFLFSFSYMLTCLGILGYLALFTPQVKRIISPNFRRSLLLMPFLLFPMAAIGGRNYDYYTTIWLPLLAILSAILGLYASRTSWRLQTCFAILYCMALLPPYSNSIMLKRSGHFDPFTTDGSYETAGFLKSNMAPTDTLFVWGYRMDMYLLTQKLSHFPFVNQLFIHPDRKITGPYRSKHIYPKHEELFLKSLRENPPTYLIYFEREEEKELPSKSLTILKNTIQNRYKQVFETSNRDYLGSNPRFHVYKLLTKP